MAIDSQALQAVQLTFEAVRERFRRGRATRLQETHACSDAVARTLDSPKRTETLRCPASTLRDGFALAAAGAYADFRTVALAVLRGRLAQVETLRRDPGEAAERRSAC